MTYASSEKPIGVPAWAAFAYRDFRLYQAARFLSITASGMLSVAIGWQVYAITHQPLALGYVGLAQFLPALGLSLPAGHAADRFDRRRVVLVCYAVLTASSLFLFGFARTNPESTVVIYPVLFLIGATRAFSGPASQALLPEIVPNHHFGNAVAWGSSIWQFAMMIGPALGGILFAWAHGAASVYAACAVCFVSALILASTMRIRTGRMEPRAISWQTLLAGVGYVGSQKMILGAISLDLFAVLLGGAVALLPIFASDILKVGPGGLGLLRAAPAIGAAGVAMLMAYRPLKRRVGVTMLACVALFGIATIGFGLSRNFTLSLLCLLVIGASDMVSVVVRQTLVQLATPPAMRGRVSAVNLVFVGASNELGEFESGVTAAWFGVVPSVVLGGLGTCVVVALWAWKFAALRKIDRMEEVAEQSAL